MDLIAIFKVSILGNFHRNFHWLGENSLECTHNEYCVQ